MKIAQAHDRFLKALLGQPGTAAALLRERLPPPRVELLADEEPELVPGSFVEPRLKEVQTDRLYRCRLKAGGELFVYCLIEHKSEPDRWVARWQGTSAFWWYGRPNILKVHRKLPTRLRARKGRRDAVEEGP